MKRLIAAVLAIALALSLAACNSGPANERGGTGGTGGASAAPSQSAESADDKGNQPAGPAQAGQDDNDGTFNVNLGSIMSGSSDFRPMDLTPAQRDYLVEVGRQAGVDITFNGDGNVTYRYPDGTTCTQTPEGTIRIETGDGLAAEIGGGWPDNEFTKLIPQPPFAVAMYGLEGDSFFVTFAGASRDDVREYGERLASAGFTLNAELADEADFFGAGPYYSYIAENQAGYRVSFNLVATICTLAVEKVG